ncbi:MAG: hypothetical protein AAFQ42_03355 [Pseudomonadota bacterium]
MKKSILTAVIAATISMTAIAGAATANPTFGLTVGGGQVNPFADKGGN